MASAFVCASLGIMPTVRHADYIGSWLEVLCEDNRAIVRAASAASKAADYLLAFRRDAGDYVEVAKATDHLDATARQEMRRVSTELPNCRRGRLTSRAACAEVFNTPDSGIPSAPEK